MKQYIKDMQPEEVIQRLKNGEILYTEDTDCHYKMIDGILYKILSNSKYVINDCISKQLDSKCYFEVEEPFKIIESGFYKTKDGSKVYISWIKTYDMDGYNLPEEDYICYGIFGGGDNVFTWDIFGKSILHNDGKIDIIGKWEE